MKLHVGFTGTRFGMSSAQLEQVRWTLDVLDALHIARFSQMTAHHGLCVGADEEFHGLCLERGVAVVGHPGPGWPDGGFCAGAYCAQTCDDILQPQTHMRRNAAIVAESQIVIAAPREMTPQKRGGTWATVAMARRALKKRQITTLHVVDREGQLMRHEEWA